jgi:hypothetical protein
MHLQVCGGDEEEGNTRACSLAPPRQTGPGVEWCGVVRRGDGRRRMMCVRIIRQNLAQSLVGLRPPFVVYFCYESASNMF